MVLQVVILLHLSQEDCRDILTHVGCNLAKQVPMPEGLGLKYCLHRSTKARGSDCQSTLQLEEVSPATVHYVGVHLGFSKVVLTRSSQVTGWRDASDDMWSSAIRK
eukprot:Blabericola_migrator_1__2500@NODE_1702_length_3972_cov_8_630474_g1102_i0_p5_GENE_NODE_1702_length_3972_cov_8_630474_g1102_i0NODE_1702_length_3972_cov_8_630474_g1102_i0_p5_ORF_typecomplete_len106_score0_42Cellsynth_D/PF03500_13/0_12_NODE_1702_length_3972_cov_8_630474_g1102_i0261578